MKRLLKLVNLNKYLYGFHLSEGTETNIMRVVDQENATAALSRAAGDQLLIAIPEVDEHGRSSDSFSSTLSAAFFVLAKVNGPTRTHDLADAAYDRLLGIVQQLLAKIDNDLTSGCCSLLSGLALTDIHVVPLYSIFGGWSGWSIEMTFEG